jgi:signal transduction histidine kinase
MRLLSIARLRDLYQRSSLAVRSTLCVGLGVMAIAVTSGVISLQVIRSTDLRFERTRLRLSTHAAVEASRSFLSGEISPQDLKTEFERSVRHQNLARCELFLPEGETAEVSAGGPENHVAGPEMELPLQGYPGHRLRLTPASGGTRAADSGLVFRVLLIVLGTAGCAVALSYLAVRSVLSPIRSISQAVHRVIGGDYETRVTVRGRDEVGQLAAAFNTMCGDLHQAHNETQKQNRALRHTITERSGVLREACAQLRTVDAMKDNILTAFSIQLKAPRSILRSIVKELLSTEDPEPIARKLVEQCPRWNNFVEDILDFVQVDAAGATLVEQADCRELVDECVARFEGRAGERKIEVVVRQSEGSPAVSWDVARFRRVFRYLVTAALRAALPGQQVTIQLELGPDEVSMVFDSPSTRSTRVEPGTRCLGFGICELMTRQMNGSLELTQSRGAFAFRMVLPRGQPTQETLMAGDKAPR